VAGEAASAELLVVLFELVVELVAVVAVLFDCDILANEELVGVNGVTCEVELEFLPLITVFPVAEVLFSVYSGALPDLREFVCIIVDEAMLDSCPGSIPTSITPTITANITYMLVLIAVKLFISIRLS
jgi:hypothetical protein